MDFSLFGGAKKDSTVLLFDIGSATVGGSLAVFSGGEEVPHVVYAVRREMPFEGEPDSKRLPEAMSKTLREVCEDIEKEGIKLLAFTRHDHAAPRRAFVTLSSPWYAAQTRIVRDGKPEKFTVRRDFVAKLAKDEIDAFIASPLVKKTVGKDPVMVIEKKMVQLKLDGYETVNPFDQKTKALSMGLYLSVAPESVLNRIAGDIRRTFFLRGVYFHSLPFAAFDVVRRIRPNLSDFLFLDVGGEMTDVSLVKDGILEETRSFPVGRRDILRKLSKKLRSNIAHAESFICLGQDGNMTAECSDREKKLFAKAGESWSTAFRETLALLSRSLSLPSEVFVSAEPPLDRWFRMLVTREEFAQFSMTDEQFAVELLTVAEVSDFVRFHKNALRDPLLALEAVFANTASRT